ncbi:MAG: UDP-N-acetylmuramate--L-alanine ligase [Thermomicrobiales bacterium]|nr:UDP-N-acetylmuramate--L-alanine ligase [Thermomicrobiales bacterium]
MPEPEATAALPVLPARVHFVGIGGIGMSGLARILLKWGYRISGSDAAPSPLLDELAAEGMAVGVGHTMIAEAASADLVVATAAVRPDNPELRAARDAGRNVVKRAALLGALADARRGVAVAGSHGKSTTSGMLVWALRALGADPTFAIGAVLEGPQGATNAAPGVGAEMVVEADEYDRSFLRLHPDVAIITNIDYDHPDIFATLEDYDQAFVDFVSGMRAGGTLVISADDPGCARVMASPGWRPGVEVVTVGASPNATWRTERTDEGVRVVGQDDVAVSLALRVPGDHNVQNAAAALAALTALGYDASAAAAALADFPGVGRRFEAKGEVNGIVVIDDYAHHPREIDVNLRAARDVFGPRRIWAVSQPHTYSRLKALLPEFAAAFDHADQVMILDVYAARETDTLGVSSADLLQLLPRGGVAAHDPAHAAEQLANLVQPGDVVLTLGAGSVTQVGPLLLEQLQARTATGAPRKSPVRRRSMTQESFPLPGRETVNVVRNAPMRLSTTWRIGGPADYLVRAGSQEDLLATVSWARHEGMPITVIGGGSNLLVADSGIQGVTILARTTGERAAALIETQDLGDAVQMRVAAQAPLSWTGRYAAEHGWSGLDWGVGLPGTIGGATVNNAGAHGTEQIDHLQRVVILTAVGDVVEEPAAWLQAAYRHTVIKAAERPRPWIVLEVVMALPKGDPVDLVRLADEHAAFRKATQPTGACAGSTFANPPGDFAGRLLEASGMKGFAVGGAMFSPKHANWIVNDGSATAADVRELIATAQERVLAEMGVELRREVEYLGAD